MLQTERMAKFLGFDLSTTALAVGVRSENGEEDFISLPMKGATKWHDQPAFDLSFIPQLLEEALKELRRRGWWFSSQGALSFSVRQHDMVILDRELLPLIPALSWQCIVAAAQVEKLQEMGAEAVVGKIEPRFILPKLMWVLEQNDLLHKICHAMTTGDYIGLMLTGALFMSTSDALSNGLLEQKSKTLADQVVRKAGLVPSWFPSAIQSGYIVGCVSFTRSSQRREKVLPSWKSVISVLSGWKVVAGLGDNHAGGIGCGLSDSKTVVVSGGSSGTVIRTCHPSSTLRGEAACFEYYQDRLLLMMLADCAVWYDRFVEKFGQKKTLAELDELALAADLTKLYRIRQKQNKQGWQEVYPKSWFGIPLAEKVASTQASIAIELLLLVKKMLQEVESESKIRKFVLTGGISRSLFFQQLFRTGLPLLTEEPQLFVSKCEGALSHQSATLGAMINAMVGANTYPDLPSAIADLCPLKSLPVYQRPVKTLHSFVQTHIGA